MNTNVKLTIAALALVGAGYALGRLPSAGDRVKSARESIRLTDGLRFEEMRWHGPSLWREGKTLTIKHETADGVVNYGRAASDQTKDQIQIHGILNGERIIIYGELSDAVAVRGDDGAGASR